MPISAATLELLVSAGLAGEALVAVVRSIDADMEAAKPAAREPSPGARSQAEYRARKAQSITRDVTSDANSDVTSDVTPGSSLPPKNNNQTPISPTSSSSLRSDEPRARDLRFEFEQEFWPAYPHKVGKPAALRAFGPARKRASLEDILAGLGRYKRDKPPDRAWCNPATFLNQDRFADEPAAPSARAGPNGRETMGSVMMDLLGAASGRENERFDENPRPGFPARTGG